LKAAGTTRMTGATQTTYYKRETPWISPRGDRLPHTVRPRTRCERSERLSRKGGGATDSGSRAVSTRPLTLRPAVTGGLPFSENLPDSEARTVPCCNMCHDNAESDDLGKVLNCILQQEQQNAGDRRRYVAMSLSR